MKLYDWTSPICKKCFDRGHEDKDCKMPKEDLHMLHKIAAFIGARLNYLLPECNSGVRGGKPVSTISVSQHKEKFFYIRIYCKLADPKLVEEKWLAEREREADGEEPPKEFKQKCLRQDAHHYRACYLDMIQLVPRLKGRIRSQADYAELLFDDEAEMRKYIDELNDPEYPQHDHVKHYREKYGVSTNEELKDELARFYKEPSWKEYRGDA